MCIAVLKKKGGTEKRMKMSNIVEKKKKPAFKEIRGPGTLK